MFGKKTDKKVDVPALVVDREVIHYGDSFISTRNISMVHISPIPANRTWIIALIVILSGIITLRESTAAGIWTLIVGIVWLVGVLWWNANRGENLAITLNSGLTLYFHCTNAQFIREVLRNLISSVKQGNLVTYTVNFRECTIKGDVVNGNKFPHSFNLKM